MMNNKAELLTQLKNVTVFSGFTDDDIRHVIDESRIVSYKPDEVILHEGMPASEIYIVVSGEVKIVVDLDHNPLEVARYGPGNCIGEAAVIGIQKNAVSVVAVREATLMVLSPKLFIEIQHTDKELFSLIILNLARELARRLTHANEWIHKLHA